MGSSQSNFVTISDKDKKELFDVIDSDKDIVGFLTSRNEVCPMIGKDIHIIRVLGKGQFGEAYSIKIDGMPKKYVAKKLVSNAEIMDMKVKAKTTLDKFALKLSDHYLVSKETIIQMNGKDPNRYLYPGKTFEMVIPVFAAICKTTVSIDMEPFVPNLPLYKIPEGSYLCTDNKYSEYAISLLCAQLNKKGYSVNFIDVFGFSTCPEAEVPGQNEFDVNQYIFMEKIDGELYAILEGKTKHIAGKLSGYSLDQLIENAIVQLCYAIAVYQKIYKLQHNDLHSKNVFFEIIRDDTEYNGEKLKGADYFHYNYEGEHIYLPYIPLLVKVGDFGLSVKFSHPIIGDAESIQSGYGDSDYYVTGLGEAPWLPNWYADNYDFLYAVQDIYKYLLALQRDVPFVRILFAEMLNAKGTTDQDIENVFNYTGLSGGGRVPIDYLDKFGGTPADVLKGNLLNKFKILPPAGSKIVDLGTI